MEIMIDIDITFIIEDDDIVDGQIQMDIYIYIYIYIQREREREIDR